MTLAINTSITEQDIKHVLESNELYTVQYTPHTFGKFCANCNITGTLSILNLNIFIPFNITCDEGDSEWQIKILDGFGCHNKVKYKGLKT